jgi:hypothetical protein
MPFGMRVRVAVIFAMLVVPQIAGAGGVILKTTRNDREHRSLLRLVRNGEPLDRCPRATIGR